MNTQKGRMEKLLSIKARREESMQTHKFRKETHQREVVINPLLITIIPLGSLYLNLYVKYFRNYILKHCMAKMVKLYFEALDTCEHCDV
jgi:hypothetical protein